MNPDISKYIDIINLPYNKSNKHPQMSMKARAAQFAPYAALTGYGDEVRETGRLTDSKIEIDEVVKEAINEQLKIVQSIITKRPQITVTYFVPDMKKIGGKYITKTGNVKKIDEIKKAILFIDLIEVPIEEIIEIVIVDNQK